ncbi:hypothetical protein C1752_01138 [Acaryochloris thomasi RCC1774]|uniref:Uncharacterized protein n=1 Tax=Acaryochloris thomasi RCC1774 TaxID=1764569 RepID=A0A2W1K1U0_9CYAN|nr:hypothetical protein [Acaryochloris thomasi]PZD74421.1 hypothetical protein C1752_01138 [Acaryochloris thomasi RCC1774]
MNGSREPLAVINFLIALVEVALMLAATFGLPLTKEQIGLIGAVLVALGNVVATVWGRSQVTPVVDAKDNSGARLFPSTP